MSRPIDVIAVGEILVDLVAPDAEDLEHATAFVRAAGGAPANVTVAAARLGARSALISAVGRDAFGAFLRATLATNEVDASWLVETDQHTTLALVARNAGGIPDFVFYRGSDAVLRPEDIPIEAIASARFLHVSSMALLSEPSRSATLHAAEVARRSGTLVSVDPNLRPSSWPSLETARAAIAPLLDAADVLKVNEEEALLLTGDDDLGAAVRALTRPGRLTVVTRGSEGALWYRGDIEGQVAAPAIEVVETTGAGDAFVGALLAELALRDAAGRPFSELSPDDIQQAVRVATAAGAFACTKVGAMAALPTRADIEGLPTR